MKKLAKLLSVLLAASLVMSTFVFVASAEGESTTVPVGTKWDFALNEESDPFTVYDHPHGGDKTNLQHPLNEDDPSNYPANFVSKTYPSNMTYVDGLLKPAYNGASTMGLIFFTAPVSGTYSYKLICTGVFQSGNCNIFYFIGNDSEGYEVLKSGDSAISHDPQEGQSITFTLNVALDEGDSLVIGIGNHWGVELNVSEFCVTYTSEHNFVNGSCRYCDMYGFDLSEGSPFTMYYHAHGAENTHLENTGENPYPANFASKSESATTYDNGVLKLQWPAMTLVYFDAPECGKYQLDLAVTGLAGPDQIANCNIFFFMGNDTDGYVRVDAQLDPGYGVQRSISLAFNLAEDDNIVVGFGNYWGAELQVDNFTVDKIVGHTGGNATCKDQAVCTVCGESYGELGDHNFVEGTCTACGEADPNYVAPAPTPSFSAAISAAPTDVSRGGSTTVKVAVNGSVYEKFAAGELGITFDPEIFDFVSVKVGDADATVSLVSGTVNVGFYGVENEFGTTVDLVFTAKDGVAIGTTSDFTLNSAAFSDAMSAVASDLVAATVTTATATTTIVAKTFNVTITSDEAGLSDAVIAATGNTTVTEEQAYVITLPEGYNRYNWTATVGENIYTEIVDGKITIPASEAKGDYTVAIVRTAKTFTVTGSVVGDELTAEDTFNGAANAVFGTDYSFSVPEATLPDPETGSAGISYSASIVYTGTETAVAFTTATVDGRVVYTVAGADITADMTVVITKTVTAVDQFTVTVIGFGADISGSETTTVNEGRPYSFTITPITGYDYTVTAEGAEIVKDGNTYTIASVTANVTVTVTRTVNTDGVEIYSYLDLNGKTVYAVTVNTALDSGYGYTYDGNAMYYNAATNEYVYLVIVEGSFEKEAAKALVSIKAGAETVTYNTDGVDYDVNVTETVDANDAQLVYNMYASKTYDSFEVASMLKFLLADVNCDHSVNVDDAAKIINLVVGAE